RTIHRRVRKETSRARSSAMRASARSRAGIATEDAQRRASCRELFESAREVRLEPVPVSIDEEEIFPRLLGMRPRFDARKVDVRFLEDRKDAPQRAALVLRRKGQARLVVSRSGRIRSREDDEARD